MTTATTATAAFHAEWIKTRTLRGTAGSLISIFVVTVGITALALGTIGQKEADNGDFEAVFGAFYALNFGQIAAIALGTTAFSSEYLNGALRVSLAAVPRRGVFYAAKTAVVGALALAVGLVTSFTSFLVGQAFMGPYAIGLDAPGALRACFGAGLYLALMALLAAGLTAVLRSGVAVLSILIPFILIVPFVVGDVAGSAAGYLPDRAGQQILHADPAEGPAPWAGIGVMALWAAAAVLAGWWCVRRRDV